MLGVVLSLLGVQPAVCSSSVVQTQYGTVVGSEDSVHRAFLGIPFAEPPIGELRFAGPKDWSKQYPGGSLNATKYASPCNADEYTPEMSEDCLYLNVCAPPLASSHNLPVMIWIYGGSFQVGDANEYPCDALPSQHPVILVTLNYRLDSFGFMAFNDGGAVSANYGLLDQRSAMRWVRANIQDFGGDPNNMLVFGESAGAISTALHILMPNSQGLFHRAIVESGFPTGTVLAFALQQSAIFAARLNCSVAGMLTCMRSKTAKQILLAQSQGPSDPLNPFVVPGWGPVIDGVEITADPIQMMFRGQINKGISVMVGSNSDEGTLFTKLLNPEGFSQTEYRAYINQTMNCCGQGFLNVTQAQIDAIEKMYPASTDRFANLNSAASLQADRSFVCGGKLVAQAVANASSASYFYHFAYTPCPPIPGLGVYHGSELPYVFDGLPGCVLDAKGQVFAKQLGTYWTNFAISGDPNKPQTVPTAWPMYVPQTDLNLILNASFAVESGRRAKYCDFWATIVS